MNDEKMTPEDWKQVRGMIEHIADEHSIREKDKTISEYKTDNPNMIKQFKAQEERDEMKRKIKAAKKRRQDPDFKYQEWK